MYNLPYFKTPHNEEVIRFMQDHPFAFLTGVDASGIPQATQVPVFVDERDGRLFISGHIMRQSEHHKAFLNQASVLVVFTGPHTYVSATWYTNPHQASTWNYMSVHARGSISFGGEADLVNVLRRLTLHFEKGDTASTTVFENLPDSYRNPLMKGIVPFEIAVEKLEHVFKLSQNRDEESYRNIISRLEEQGGDGQLIAGEMRQRIPQLFNKTDTTGMG